LRFQGQNDEGGVLMKKRFFSVGVLAVGVLTLALANWAVASKPSEDSGAAFTNPDGDLVCPANATEHSQCTDVERGPTVYASGPVIISSPTTATLQVTCRPPHPGGQPGPTGLCEGPIKTYMNGQMDSKNYVHLQPNTPTTIQLTLTSAGRAQVARAYARGPGLSKGTCPVVADMSENDNGPKTTTSHAPDFIVA
jgi:hypothetical protein